MSCSLLGSVLFLFGFVSGLVVVLSDGSSVSGIMMRTVRTGMIGHLTSFVSE